jgi:hypothetical protein
MIRAQPPAQNSDTPSGKLGRWPWSRDFPEQHDIYKSTFFFDLRFHHKSFSLGAAFAFNGNAQRRRFLHLAEIQAVSFF